jgi:hypothetical protein
LGALFGVGYQQTAAWQKRRQELYDAWSAPRERKLKEKHDEERRIWIKKLKESGRASDARELAEMVKIANPQGRERNPFEESLFRLLQAPPAVASSERTPTRI